MDHSARMTTKDVVRSRRRRSCTRPRSSSTLPGRPFEFNVEGGGVMSHERFSQRNAGFGFFGTRRSA